MNMFLHGINFSKFSITLGDTLINQQFARDNDNDQGKDENDFEGNMSIINLKTKQTYIVMIYPMMIKVDFKSVKYISKNPK